MVYSRYIWRNKKRYGPYYYETRRVGARTITKYVSAPLRPTSLWLVGLLALVFTALSFVVLYFIISPTGHATLNIASTIAIGQPINGTLILTLEPKEFLPADTQIVLSLGDQEKTLSLSELVSSEQAVGAYYVSGTILSGAGQGYGAGTETIYPEVSFELVISKGGSGGVGRSKETEKKEEPKKEELIEEKQKESEAQGEEVKKEKSEKESEKTSEVKEEGQEKEEQSKEAEKKEETKGSENKAEKLTETTAPAETSEQTITGAVVAENTESVSGSVRKDKEFTYELKAGERASLKSGSVKIEGQSADDSFVQVASAEGKVIVTTEHETRVNASESVQLEIALSSFNLTAEKGILQVRVIAQGNELIRANKEITFEEQETEGNESEEQEEIVSNATAKNATVESAGNATLVNATLNETNITLIGNETLNLTFVNATVKTSRAKIRVGEKVRWVKNVSLERAENVTLELPKEAENVSVKKVDEETQETSEAVAEIRGITGQVTAEIRLSEKSGFTRFVLGLFGRLTGKAISSDGNASAGINESATTGGNASVEVTLADNATEYVIEYYTEAPTATESETANGKQVVISGPDSLNYTDVESFTEIPEILSVGQEAEIRIYWQENASFVAFAASDTQGNGYLDYIEWITPHLSNQTFNIILITKAEHLNETRGFIEDVYDFVKTRDENFTTIPAGQYIRVTFERNLTNDKDITIYARSVQESSVQVYERDANTSIANFGTISDNQKYRILLTNLQGSQNVFDLKTSGGAVDFDYIVDPAVSYNITFVLPTPADGATINDDNVTLNVSVTNASDLSSFIWNWNGTNTTMYNDSLVLMMNFDNVSAIGDNETHVKDASRYGNNGTLYNGAIYNISGRYGSTSSFDGVDDRLDIPHSSSLVTSSALTVEFWFRARAGAGAVMGVRSPAASQGWQIGYNDSGGNSIYYIGTGAWTSITLTAPSAGVWHHLAQTWNGSQFSLYIDGANQSQVAKTGTISTDSAITYIGNSNAASFFNGSIDEFRLWNRSLSATEVNESYKANLYKYANDSWGFVSNQSYLTDQIYTYQAYVTDTANNQNTTGQRSVTVEAERPGVTINLPTNSTYNYTQLPLRFNVTLSENGSLVQYSLDSGVTNVTMSSTDNRNYNVSSTLTAERSYVFRVYANDTYGNRNDSTNVTFYLEDIPQSSFVNPTPADGATINDDNVTLNVSVTNASDLSSFIWNWNGTNTTMYNDSLVLMMNFDNVSAIGDNETHVKDASRYGNNGTLYNGAIYNISGRYGSTSSFDGVDDRLDIPHSSSLVTSSALTVEFWFRARAGAGAVMGVRSPAASQGWQIGYNDSGGNSIYYIGTGAWTSITLTAPSAGVWHHLAQTWNGSQFSLYIDGANQSQVAKTGTISTDSAITYIGNSNAASFFNGSIDEFRLWNRSLSATEVNESYKANLYKYANDSWGFVSNQSYLTDQIYTYQAYVTDTANNQNTTGQRSVTVEAERPGVTINLPTNSTYNYTQLPLRFNVTLSENGSLVQYSLDSGVTNVTMSSTDNRNYNVSSTLTAERSYVFRVYASDTGGNRNDSTNVTFYLEDIPQSSFVNPTPADGATINDDNVTLNVSVTNASDLSSFIWNWNGTNYTIYNDSLVLMLNFDNVSAIGDNETHVKDVSRYCYDNATEILALEEVSCSEVTCGDEEVYCGEGSFSERMNTENKEEGAFLSAPKEKVFHQKVTFISNNSYINFSTVLESAEASAAVPRTVRELSDTQYLSPERTLGSNPSRSASALSNTENAAGKKCYVERWKYFNDLGEGEQVMTLNQETGEKEWQEPRERQEFDSSGEMYEIVLEDGSVFRVSEEHKVYVNEERGIISNLSSYTAIKLPLNSSALTSLSNRKKAFLENSILLCGIFNQTTENTLSLDNFVKSLSFVTSTLSSDLEDSANSPLASPLGFEIMSTPFCLRNLSNLLSTFSSNKNLRGEADNDILFPPHNFSDILKSCCYMLSLQGGKRLEDFFNGSSISQHLQNLPDHNARAFEGWLAVANLTVNNDVFIDFDSHKFRNSSEIYNSFGLRPVTDVFADVQTSPAKNIAINSEVVNTLTSDCSLRCGSLDQIEAFVDKANARKSLSSGSEITDLAFIRNSSYSDSSMKVINSSISKRRISNPCSDNADLAKHSERCLSISDLINSGAMNSALIDENMYEAMENGFISENKMLLSMTNSIHSYSRLFPGDIDFNNSSLTFGDISLSSFLNLPFFALLPNSTDHSVSSCSSLELSRFNMSCFASSLLSNCTSTLDTSMFDSSACAFNSSGIVITTSAMPESSVSGYKNFTLRPVTDVYADLRDDKDVYFMDADGKAVKIRSIEKVPYDGKIYDVDVGNDVVLVRRQGSREIWSGNSNNGTLINGATYNVSGRYGSAGRFDGIDDYVQVPDSDNLDIAGNMTIVLWFKADVDAFSDRPETLIGKRPANSGLSNYQIYFTNSTRAFRFYNGASEIEFGFAPVTGQWTHLVFVMNNNSNSATLYINGAANNTQTASMGAVGSGPLWIGYRDDTVDEGFNGTLDEVRIWNRTLSAAEINQSYQSNFYKYANDSWGFVSNQSYLTTQTYTYQAYATDTAGNQNTTGQRSVTVDTTAPVVNITYPLNNSNFTKSSVVINYTLIETNAQTCWWTNNSGVSNNTITCGANITSTFTVGQQNVSVYANDSVNNVGSSSVRFAYLPTAPNVTIYKPENTTYGSTGLPVFNVSLNTTNGSLVQYSLDGGVTNVTMSATDNRNYNASNNSIAGGSYVFRVYANDTAENRNDSTQVTFSIDTTLPTINYSTGTESDGTNLTRANIVINVTASDGNLSNITIYVFNSSGVKLNETTKTTSENWVNITSLGDGNYTFNATATDGVNNRNSTASRVVWIDTTMPQISYTGATEGDNANLSRTWVFVNVSVTEANEQNITFTLYNATASVNVTTFTTSERVINWTGLADGSYTFNVSVVDRVNQRNTTATRTIRVDTAIPGIGYGAGTEVNGSAWSRTWSYANISLNESFLANVTYTLYNTTGSVNVTTFAGSTTTFNWTSLADGVYYFNVSAADTANNRNTTLMQTITLDNVVPATLTFVAPSDEDNVNVSRNLTFVNVTATDNVGVQAIVIRLYNASRSLNASRQNASSPHAVNFTNLPDGIWYFNASVNDSVNLKNESATRTIRVDTTIPNIGFVNPTETNATTITFSSILVNVTGSDSGVGLANITIYVFNASHAQINTTTSTSSPAYLNASGLQNGTYYFNATSTDLLNQRNYTDRRTVIVSTQPVVINYVAPTESNASYVSRTFVLVNVSVVNASALSTVIIYLYNASQFLNTSSTNTTAAGHYVNFSGLAEGEWYFNATANDTSANNGSIGIRVVTVDTTTPSISYQGTTVGDRENTSRSWIFVNVSVTETNEANVTFVLYNLSGSVNTTTRGAGNRTFNWTNLADGNYTYNVSFTDLANNKGNTSTRNVVLDTTAPASGGMSKQNVVQYGNVTLRVNASDSGGLGAGIASLFYANGTFLANYTMTLNVTAGGFNLTLWNLSVVADYDVNYTLNDSAGNSRRVGDNFYVYRALGGTVAGNVTDALGTVKNYTFVFRRPGTNITLLNFTNSSYSFAADEIVNRSYDMEITVGDKALILREMNFTTSYIPVNVDNLSIGITNITNYKILAGLGVNATTYTGNATLNLSYTYNSDNAAVTESNLTVHKCSNWNYTDRVCNEGFALDGNKTVMTEADRMLVNASSFSAYLVTEYTCGNSVCQAAYGETTSTCATDCASASPGSSSSGGGGGGGGGTTANATKEQTRQTTSGGLQIGLAKIERELTIGENATERLTLINGKDTALDVKFLLDKALRKVVEVPEKISIESGETKVADIIIHGSKEGVYQGNLYLFSVNFNQSIPVQISVLSLQKKLLDISVSILKERVSAGSELPFKADIYNLGQQRQYDIALTYDIVRKDNNESILHKEEQTVVGATLSVVRSIELPKETLNGEYKLIVTANYGEGKAEAFASFVVEKSFIPEAVSKYAPLVMLMLVVGFILFIGVYYLVSLRRQLKAKKMSEKLKNSVYPAPDFLTLPQSKYAYVGVIADADEPAYLDHTQLNRHTLIAGGTGCGKTVAAMDVVEELLKKGVGVVVFDPVGQWSGFAKRNTDEKMRRLYPKFKLGLPQAYKPRIVNISDATMNVDVVHYLQEKGLTILRMDKLTPKKVDGFIEGALGQIYRANLNESGNLKSLVVLDEVHRLLPKYGGRKAYTKLEQAVREFRKWGIGLLMISQVLTDFKGAIRGNIGTEIQMHTRYEGDIKRVRERHGAGVSKLISKLPTGLGLVECADYNKGNPYFIEFRPLLHSPYKLTEAEAKQLVKKETPVLRMDVGK